MFNDFPPEAVVKTLARILLVARRDRLEHYSTARAVFDQTRALLELQYRDVLVLTTGEEETHQLQEIRDHQLELALSESLGSPEIEKLVNHPVHISDHNSLSSFIPFCSSGAAVSGKTSSSFTLPVCEIFREKILNGQLCYEADVDSYLREHETWDQTLDLGFNFIVDFNEEYDVKNLIPTQKSKEKWPPSSSTLYLQARTDQIFDIMLNTISQF